MLKKKQKKEQNSGLLKVVKNDACVYNSSLILSVLKTDLQIFTYS